MKEIEINGRTIGSGHPAFVIAEAGVNHDGDLDRARQLVDAAVNAGADAVKFQTFSAERLVSRAAPKAEYQLHHTDSAESQFEMLRRLELPEQAHRELLDYCTEKGVLFLSTPFDERSADFLDELGISAYKISSGDVTNHPFLAHIAGKQKPIILSTGMATLGEVELAVNCIREAGGRDLVLLHCVTNYPAEPKDCNLRAMRTMADAFELPAGWSDHTPGIEVSLAAVALGACVIEKHFTLDRSLPGPDHQASLEPDELMALVKGIRAVEQALGDGVKQPVSAEMANTPIARKSLHWNRALPAGAVVSFGDLIALRPGMGISPSEMSSLVGRKLARAVDASEMVSESDLEAPK